MLHISRISPVAHSEITESDSDSVKCSSTVILIYSRVLIIWHCILPNVPCLNAPFYQQWTRHVVEWISVSLSLMLTYTNTCVHTHAHLPAHLHLHLHFMYSVALVCFCYWFWLHGCSCALVCWQKLLISHKIVIFSLSCHVKRKIGCFQGTKLRSLTKTR